MDLNAAPAEMGLSSLLKIATNLTRIFGHHAWENLELETISLELGFVFDDLLRDKINLLQILNANPLIYYNDVLFFLHTVNVTNDNITDFQTIPLPSSLEIAYAHTELSKLYSGHEYGSGVKKTVQYILTLEGYSEPVWPFNEMGLKPEDFHKGQEPQDTKNKEEAIKRYIQGMNDDSDSRSNS